MSNAPDFVEQLLVTCLDRDPADWQGAIESAAEEHPDSAAELRARFAAIQGIEPPPEQPLRRLGEFLLDAQIGSGGMGIVFRARQESLDRTVAVKLVRPEYQFFDQARARFAREIEAVARLQHPSVVSIHAIGGPEDPPFYAMDLLPGRTLAQVLEAVAGRAPESLTGADFAAAVAAEAPDPLPPPFAGSWVDACVALCTQVAEGLAHAHARQILHRDIKPSNIIVTPDGRAVILDFGLASLAEGPGEQRLTRTGSSLGTIAYMAPERLQVSARPPSAPLPGEAGSADDVAAPPATDISRSPAAAADVYSLGVTLYELLSLRLPFDGEGLAHTQALISEGQPIPLRARNRQVREETQTVCATAMARHIGDRYNSAADFAADLRRLIQRQPILAQPPGVLRRSLRFVQRRPALTAALALSAVLAVGVPTLMWAWSRGHARELATLLSRERDANAAAQRARNALALSLDEEREAKQRAVRAEAAAVAARDRATAQSLELRSVVEFLAGIFSAAIPSLHGGDPDLSARQLVDRGASRVQEFLGSRPGPKARVDLILATIYGGLGRSTEAARHAQAAIDYYRQPAVQAPLLHAEGLRLLAANRVAQRQWDEALTLAREAWKRADPLLSSDDRRRLSFLDVLGQLVALRGDAAAQVALREAVEARHGTDGIVAGVLHAALGAGLAKRTRYTAALPHLRRAVALLVDGERVKARVGARALQHLATTEIETSVPTAETTCERARRVFQKHPLLGPDHYLTLSLEVTLLDLQRRLHRLPADGAARLGTLADRLERKLRPEHVAARTARIHQMSALVHQRAFAAALALCREHQLVAAARAIHGPHGTTLANVLSRRARCESATGDAAAALQSQAAAVAIRCRGFADGSAYDSRAGKRLVADMLAQAGLARMAGKGSEERRVLAELMRRIEGQPVWIRKDRESGVHALLQWLDACKRDGDGAAARVAEWLERRRALVR